ncbi:hypothetical protein [Halalkalibacter akibai]|uniref:Cell shape determination protein CcmA n=1 Tax=Halalkalibacter akibai (strain ATCC 43226 / DSM 21942 / CIP 109018 / JCM 9157 / 1139) TaxID=1236973 RepID=W4QZK3_HALA3|nr:hypothetical protein [Halalkalibacter akibai]GAE37098.1 hypothetical protein JCM9157_4345 [Halalkalibacter akibai JCM 9157]
MKIIAGDKKENLIIESDALVIGRVEGDIKVLSGAKLFLEAQLTGNIHLNKHSHVSIQNNVSGNVYDYGATIEIVKGKVIGEIISE